LYFSAFFADFPISEDEKRDFELAKFVHWWLTSFAVARTGETVQGERFSGKNP
jgi:hypothetical protein